MVYKTQYAMTFTYLLKCISYLSSPNSPHSSYHGSFRFLNPGPPSGWNTHTFLYGCSFLSSRSQLKCHLLRECFLTLNLKEFTSGDFHLHRPILFFSQDWHYLKLSCVSMCFLVSCGHPPTKNLSQCLSCLILLPPAAHSNIQ